MRSAVQLYALAVCFCALMCLVVSLGIGLYDVVRMIVPSFTLANAPYFDSNEQYVMYYPDKKELPENEITERRLELQRSAVAAERRTAGQGLVFAAIIIAIDLAVYAVHWRIALSNKPH